METIEHTIEVDAPVRTVYNQWTQFEDFPEFMDGVEEVRQLDDRRLHWAATIGGKRHEWEAEITEQLPDQKIAWRAVGGKMNLGEVTFDKTGENRTLVRVTMAYEPEGVMEKVGDAMGLASARVKGDLERFKKFVESRSQETGAWRGEIHGGQVARDTGNAPRSKRLYGEKTPSGTSEGGV